MILVAAAGGALVAMGSLLGGLYAAGIFDGPSGPAAARGAASAGAPGKPFAGLDNKQIRARIEAAKYKVLVEDDKTTATTWMLVGMNGCYVQVIRMDDLKAAETMEQTLLKQPGATTRDGTTVLHVHLLQAGPAKALLAQIVR